MTSATVGMEQRIVRPSSIIPEYCNNEDWRFYCQSSHRMPQVDDNSIALTVTSPPYWNAIDYDLHADQGGGVWHRQRDYSAFGDTYRQWLQEMRKTFAEVHRATMPGGFCAIVIGTILHKKKHYPAPFDAMEQMCGIGWEFHQDIIWNKVTGGVKRAGVFIQHPKPGYYYPNIMTEYILVFRKAGEHRRGVEPCIPIDDLFKRDIANNIWHIAPVPPRTIDHPCPYPDELVRRLVLLYSMPGDEVLDPFLGSGQTARVAIAQGRKVVGYDIEQAYIAMAAERIHTASGRTHNLVPAVNRIPA